MQHNARVLAALLDQPDPDLARVVHHAVAAHGLLPLRTRARRRLVEVGNGDR